MRCQDTQIHNAVEHLSVVQYLL